MLAIMIVELTRLNVHPPLLPLTRQNLLAESRRVIAASKVIVSQPFNKVYVLKFNTIVKLVGW